MRIYFLSNDNSLILKKYFISIYNLTICTFERSIIKYRKKIVLYELVYDNSGVIKWKILLNELICTTDQLKDLSFKKFYINWGMELFKKIRYDSVSSHTDECIIRAVFDIMFKYSIDFEYNISNLCCNNLKFKTLQFEILRDLRWKLGGIGIENN